MKLYAISGLGADKRVYDFLNLNAEIVHLDWIDPYKNEKIENYSLRLAKAINTDENYGIIGLSFGGLIATEISKTFKPTILILISSAETKYQLPFLYRCIGRLKLLTLLPPAAFYIPKSLAKYLFGTENVKLLNQILDDTDLSFAKWAVNELQTWKNTDAPNNLLKIHGTNDKIIPIKKIQLCSFN